MAILQVRGEVDLLTRDSFQRTLDRGLETDGDLVLDLSELRFIDGAGLRGLARTADRLDQQGRRLSLDRPSPHLRRLLTLVGLGRIAVR
jgi:anti-anti-sigma factor